MKIIRTHKILGGGDANVMIQHPQYDLSNLKPTAIGVFAFSMFARWAQTGTVLLTDSCCHCGKKEA